MSFHDKTTNVAKGKWKGILLHFGVPEAALTGKHAACPLCGGDDRFRYDNKDGRGTSICSHCGARDGMTLAMEFTDRTFPEVAREIDGLVGNVKPDAAKPVVADEDRRRMMMEAWKGSKPIEPGDLAHRYLVSRQIEELVYPQALRFAPAMRDGEGGVRPCMIAMVGVPGQEKFVSMHRTFLRPDGQAKAEMDSPRKMMPGELPPGACVMLSAYTGGALGIAEGIETALSASALWGLPVWAAINATMMAKWLPPEGCAEVAIFADHDQSHTGHAAAFTLSRRLRSKGIHTTVHVPPREGEDWADVYMARKSMHNMPAKAGGDA